MALDTCLVFGYIYGQDGQPVPGGQLQSRLNKVDRDGGLVVPTRDSVVTADDEGYFEAPLWSNARGDTGSQYIFRTRYPDGGNIGQWTGTVPDEETAQFHVIIDTDPPPTLSDAQTAQNAAETAAYEALGHKQDSAGSATAAAASAATAETQATASAASATASAASATASGNSETAAGISAGEAVASATAAASSETQSAGSAAQSAASATESQGFSIDSAASATAAASEKDDAVAAKVASEAAVQGSEDFATLSQTWATGTEPAGAGTLSSREEADRAEAAKVAAEASTQRVDLLGALEFALDLSGQLTREAERVESLTDPLVALLELALDQAGQVTRQVNGGRVLLRGGSLADPALTIGTAKIYSSAADTLSIGIGDSEIVRVTSAGLTLYGTLTEV